MRILERVSVFAAVILLILLAVQIYAVSAQAPALPMFQDIPVPRLSFGSYILMYFFLSGPTVLLLAIAFLTHVFILHRSGQRIRDVGAGCVLIYCVTVISALGFTLAFPDIAQFAQFGPTGFYTRNVETLATIFSLLNSASLLSVLLFLGLIPIALIVRLRQRRT